MSGDRAAALLERTTKSDGWVTVAYPSCGEAVVYWQAGEVVADAAAERALRLLYEAFDIGAPQPSTGRLSGLGRELDPTRSARVAAARARTKVRRYCKANGLSRLLTLTYGEQRATTHEQATGDVAKCLRRLRDTVGKFPYVWVPELHGDGEHYHLHLATGRAWAVRCRVCDPAGTRKGLKSKGASDPCLRCAWGHGFVHAKRLAAPRTGRWDAESAAATYLAKYVGKSYEDHRTGLHRYDCARGFAPERVTLDPARDEVAAARAARSAVGLTRRPRHVWTSDGVDDWHGPPTRVLFW